MTSIPRVGKDGERERERERKAWIERRSKGERGRETGGGGRDSRGLLQERKAEREYLGKFKL